MNRIVKAARIVLATLREIFDEAAYDRFLASNADGIISEGLRCLPPGIRRCQHATTQVLLSA